MRKTARICCAITFSLAILIGSPALAQSAAPLPSSETRWTVTGFIGPGFGGDLDETETNLGIATSYNFNPRIAVEGELSYASDGADDDLVEFGSSLWTVSGNVLYHFTGNERFLPYATAGLGLMRTSLDLEVSGNEIVDESNNELAVNLGGGVKSHLTEWAHLRGDLRFFNGGDVDDNFWRAYVGVTFMLRR